MDGSISNGGNDLKRVGKATWVAAKNQYRFNSAKTQQNNVTEASSELSVGLYSLSGSQDG